MEKVRVVQANLNNQGGAFSVIYEAQQKLQDEYVFDYFSAEEFIKNDVYFHLREMGSKCIGGVICKNRFLKQYEVYKAFKEFLKKNQYNYVHIHADTAWKMSVYYLAAKKAGVKNIVVHSHSSGINGHFKKLNYLLHLVSKRIIRRAQYRCACSDVAALWMYDTTKNIIKVQNGVDIDRFSYNGKARERIRKELNIQDKTVIGTVGDFSYPKNPEFIYDLIIDFKDESQYVFLLVGNREGCELVNKVKSNPNIKNVMFLGTVTNIPDYLSAMDVFILPSRFEGLPMCAIEAQVSGLFTIISDKVTSDTCCSKRFLQIGLDIVNWKKEIIKYSTECNREKNTGFLITEKASADSTAFTLKKIYSGEI